MLFVATTGLVVRVRVNGNINTIDKEANNNAVLHNLHRGGDLQ